CYHMMEVFPRPDHVAMWHDLAFGKPVGWDKLFADFQSTVDWPSTRFWRELTEHYPDAKVILSLRDPAAWWKSMNETIYQPMKLPVRDTMPPVMRQQMEMVRKLVSEDTFHGRFEDRDYAMEVFRKHNEEVRRTIDQKRLLVFEAKDGWGPLCRFLGVPEPSEPYPRLNDTASTQAMIQTMPARAATY